ncbi:MAG: helix-turn-helix transcriptional regulator [Planctomycetota bacterium]
MPRPLSHPDIRDVELVDVLAALSDPVRLEIVRTADDSPGPLPCNAFFEAIPRSTLSHHWKILRDSGLIWQETKGTTRLNSVRRVEMDERFPGLLDAVLAAAVDR